RSRSLDHDGRGGRRRRLDARGVARELLHDRVVRCVVAFVDGADAGHVVGRVVFGGGAGRIRAACGGGGPVVVASDARLAGGVVVVRVRRVIHRARARRLDAENGRLRLDRLNIRVGRSAGGAKSGGRGQGQGRQGDVASNAIEAVHCFLLVALVLLFFLAD